jgi:hypothetical protein
MLNVIQSRSFVVLLWCKNVDQIKVHFTWSVIINYKY